VRIATWNVNSLKARMPRVEEWLEYAQPDVLAMQETKLKDEAFPSMAFSGLGYDSAPHGHNQWNGVALLSKVGLDNITSGFDSESIDPYEGDARLVAAKCGGIDVVCVYVPNGREVGTEFYERKLVWLEVLHDWIDKTYSPTDPLIVTGDFNVAPEDRDVWSPKAFVGATHVTKQERGAVKKLEQWGLVDAFRTQYPDTDSLVTYWDYRGGDFHKHKGMRIDLMLVTQPVAERITWATIDRNARKGKGPSDHTPLLIDLAD
jgi:exodeoxyribonuclease-3